MTIGERIKKRRLELGLSVVQVAKKLNKDRTTVYRYESDYIETLPTSILESLAEVLHTTPGELMGWTANTNAPTITDNYVTFPVIGEVAAHYDMPAIEDWSGDTIDIPSSMLKGRRKDEFFVLKVKGDSMYPQYQDGDKVLVLKQETMNYSGQIGVVVYDGNIGTLKRVEYIMGENWMRLVPTNPSYPPVMIRDEALEQCKVLGVPKLLIREVEE